MRDEITGYKVIAYHALGDSKFIVHDTDYTPDERHDAITDYNQFRNTLKTVPKSQLRFDKVELREIVSRLIEKYPE